MPLRLTIVDDSPQFLAAFESAVATRDALTLVGTGSCSEDVPRLLALAPDVLFLDLLLHGRSALESVSTLTAGAGSTAVVVLTSHDAPEIHARARVLGAVASFVKEDLLAALDHLAVHGLSGLGGVGRMAASPRRNEARTDGNEANRLRRNR